MIVKLPNGKEIEYRGEKTKKALFAYAVKKGKMTTAEANAALGATPKKQVTQPDVPTGEFTGLDKTIGTAENAISTITGMAGDVIGGWAGLGGLVAEKAGLVDDARGLTKKVSNAMTYEPRTEHAKHQQQVIGEGLGFITDGIDAVRYGIGDPIAKHTGSAALATTGAMVPELALELAAGFAGKKLVDKARKSRNVKHIGTEDLVKGGNAEELLMEASGGHPSASHFINNDEFLKLAEKHGIDLSLGDATGDFAQRKRENFLAQQGGEVGDAMRDHQAKKYAQIQRGVESVEPVNPKMDAGAEIKKALEQEERRLKVERAEKYQQLTDVTQGIESPVDVNALNDAMPDAGMMRDLKANSSGGFSSLENLLTEFKVIEGKTDFSEVLTIKNGERFRKRLNAIEKASPELIHITAPIKKAYDAEFESLSRHLEANGAPDVANAAKEARMSHIALRTTFDDKGLAKSLIKNKSRSNEAFKEASQVYPTLVQKSTPIEQYERVINIVKNNKRAINTLRGELVMDLVDSSLQGLGRKVGDDLIMSPAQYIKRFDLLEPKLKATFTPAQFNKLKEFRQIAHRVNPPNGTIPVGSAGFFIEAMDKLAISKMFSLVPGVGPVVYEGMRGAATAYRQRSQVKKALNQHAYSHLDKLFPSLAAASGVSVLDDEDNEI